MICIRRCQSLRRSFDARVPLVRIGLPAILNHSSYRTVSQAGTPNVPGELKCHISRKYRRFLLAHVAAQPEWSRAEPVTGAARAKKPAPGGRRLCTSSACNQPFCNIASYGLPRTVLSWRCPPRHWREHRNSLVTKNHDNLSAAQRGPLAAVEQN
jgi:hypothetical protein